MEDDTGDAEVIEGATRAPRTFVMEGDPFSSLNSDADIDEAFIEMQQAFQKAQSPGQLRVFRVPLDENGNPAPKAQSHFFLASYQIDQYSYDELMAVLKARFMKPGETMTVRVCATRPNQRGYVINRMMTIVRESEPDTAPGGIGQLGDVLRMMQESNQKTSEMMERILTPKNEAQPQPVSKRDGVDTMIAIAGALTPLLTPLIAGMMNRPKPQSDLGGMIDAIVKLKGLASGETPAGEGDDNSTMALVKALGPGVINAFTEIAKRQPVAQYPAPLPPRALAPPRPVAVPTVAPPVESIPSAPVEAPISADTKPTEGNPMLKIIKEQLSELITLAESGTDPAAAAQLAGKLIPPQYDEQLLELIETPEAFKLVTALDPRCEKHAVWLEAWRATLLSQFEAEQGPGE
jgi:hypothetical protein